MKKTLFALSFCIASSFSFALESTSTTLSGPKVNSEHARAFNLKLNNKIQVSFDSITNVKKAIQAINIEKTKYKSKSKEYIGLFEIACLADIIANNFHNQEIVNAAIDNIQEINTSLIYRQRRPIPHHVYLHKAPGIYLDAINNPVGLGKISDRAKNLQQDQETPTDSTFWKNPGDIASKDLFYGFNRNEMPRFDNKICDYGTPKPGTGTNPGFSIICNDRTYYLKFAEESTSAFATRIFWALGYNVNILDNAQFIQFHYTRKMFKEYNSRTDLTTSIKLFPFLTLGKIHLQKYHDPFKAVRHAVLKSGEKISGENLRAFLLKNPKQKMEKIDDNYIIENENKISHIVTKATSIEIKRDDFIDIGAWTWDTLGHQDRRELRGLGLLAAWLNWYDARWDNNKLRFLNVDNKKILQHVISDVGSVLGVADKSLNKHHDNPEKFPMEFTTNKNGVFKITTFQTIEDNLAFKKMNTDDAKWMAQMIAALTPEQIHDALIASGFPKTSCDIYLKKLLARREKMLKDLEL